MKDIKQTVTFLGKGTEFEGKLWFSGTIRIDGHFKGEIVSGGNLIIGEDGKIEADIHASYIIIQGEIHGNIIADQRIDIHAPGKVFGNIQSPTVVMDEGVILEGTTRMCGKKSGNQVKVGIDIVASDEYHGEPPLTLTGIYGIVKDQKLGNPIKNVTVDCKGAGKKKIETNTSGYYELTDLEDGKWKLIVKAKGYKKEKTKVEISGGGTYEKNFYLKPK
ncbi:MAG TPA: polymer-forming cytoskeletal protein [Desulfobacterales bacterium]|nr:polymer-forming cytoskeletal protein [Desulfobacterales bacterium]